MKAVYFERFGGPEVLVFGERPTPKPAADQVLIEVHAAGVNPRDWMLRQGTYFARPLVGRPPIIPGSDVSGVVVEAGAEVKGLAVGDEVFAMQHHLGRMGAYAEYVAIKGSCVARKPPSVSHADAAAAPVAAMTAWQSLYGLAGITTGQRVTVVGAAGGVGHYAVQLARAAGARVTGVCGPDNLQFVGELGAETVIDRRQTDFTDAVRDQDVVFDTIGRESLRTTARCLTRRGRYISTVPTRDSVLGAALTAAIRTGRRSQIIFVIPRRADLERIGAALAAGTLRSVVQHVYPLAEAAEAHRQSRTFHTRGKLVLQARD